MKGRKSYKAGHTDGGTEFSGRERSALLQKSGFMNKKVRDLIFIYSMLLIPALNFVLFSVCVNFESVFLGFRIKKDGQEIWTPANFIRLWKEISSSGSQFSVAIGNTLLFFFSNLLITLPVSLLLCYFLYKKIAGYRAFRFIFYLPGIIAPTVLAILFKYVITNYRGPLYNIYKRLGREFPDFLTEGRALWTIWFYQVIFSFGGNIVLLSGAMSHIDESVTEAARLDGVTMGCEIFRIVIPLIWPTLSTLITFAFVGLFGASGPVLLFFKENSVPYDTKTISYWIFEQVRYGSEYYYPSAIGLVCTVIGAPIAFLVRRLLGRILDEEVA